MRRIKALLSALRLKSSLSNCNEKRRRIYTNTIAKANLPNYTLYSESHTHTYTGYTTTNSHGLKSDGDAGYKGQVKLTSSSNRTSGGTTITVKSGGSGTALNNMQPYIVLNYIIRAS